MAKDASTAFVSYSRDDSSGDPAAAENRRIPSRIWPTCFVLIGAGLLNYREMQRNNIKSGYRMRCTAVVYAHQLASATRSQCHAKV